MTNRRTTISDDRTGGDWTRRDFLLMSALAGTGAALGPRAVLGDETLRIAVAGLGERGRAHLAALAAQPGATVKAVCDKRLAALDHGLRSAAAGTAPAPDRDFRDLCARDDVDAVTLAVPASEIAGLAIAACHAGKHVFLDRPAWPDADAARRLAAEAAQHGRTVHLRRRVGLAAEPAVAGALFSTGSELTAASVVHRPGRADRRPPVTVLADLVDEIDFALQLLGGGTPVSVRAMAGRPHGPGPRLRLSVGLAGASDKPGTKDLVVEILGPAPGAPAPGASWILSTGRRTELRVKAMPLLRGQGLASDLGSFVLAARRPTSGAVALPIEAALAADDLIRSGARALASGRTIE